MTVQQYLEKINVRFKSGISTEHSYRGDLQILLESLASGVQVTNEPTRIACGAPDYIITKKGIPVGYIEAKDLGIDLHSKTLKEQFDRYRSSLSNLIITDYLDFQLFIDGEFKTSVRIGRIEGNKVVPISEKLEEFATLIKDFCTYEGQTIKSSKKLAEMMAGKAKLLAVVIENALNADLNPDGSQVHEDANNTLRDQLKAFQDILIHDITPKEFADIYAQTIAYGMFAARLHDPDLNTFSRVEAAERIPKTNPFLRKLFQYVAGYDLDTRIQWIVDALADIFRATDVRALISNFGKATKQQDPIIHFYETFLSEYDPKLRKARGVWYTPEPVVNFIVRAVDDILKTEFDLPQGLADNSKTKIKVEVQGKKVEQEVHRVQILDPATGTGTFLAEVIKQIHEKFKGQEGIWSNYVENHLIPRLNGFELLMASYAMAHLKLDLLLTETGYKSTKEQRFRVYLTNSLEEYHPETGTLFANWLSTEANEANRIKRDTPVMVVLGNPPYSGISSNNGEWISNLIEEYKYIDGIHFKERKHWLNDDYVKFIRYGQYYIEKNGSGILAYINPHGFLDNPTFRGMRWNLLQTFDKIYTIDLHGNTKKNETAPDGSPDINVFDIMQGVAITFFIKTGKKRKGTNGQLLHYEIFGKRENKYEFLMEKSIHSISFKELTPEKPYLFFIPKNNTGKITYEKGFRIDSLFLKSVTGIVSMGDNFIIEENLTDLKKRLEIFVNNGMSEEYLNNHYGLGKNYAEWITQNRLSLKIENSKFTKLSYRIFDDRYTYFDNKLLWRWRVDVMKHFLKGPNIGIDLCRQIVSEKYTHIFITNKIVDDSFVSNKSRERGYVYPLYIYSENDGQQSIENISTRTPNLNKDIVNLISRHLTLDFSEEKEVSRIMFAPIDLLDYIYSTLHSPKYRITYNEFLRIDFPYIPYPTNKDTFWKLVDLGSQLRQLHLLESPKVDQYITKYPVSGSNEVDKLKYTNSRVYINDTQYFEGVPEVAWNFYIGGYQPAQKWLKDRKGRTLSFDDILHYQKIIVALTETDRLMREIDEVIEL